MITLTNCSRQSVEICEHETFLGTALLRGSLHLYKLDLWEHHKVLTLNEKDSLMYLTGVGVEKNHCEIASEPSP